VPSLVETCRFPGTTPRFTPHQHDQSGRRVGSEPEIVDRLVRSAGKGGTEINFKQDQTHLKKGGVSATWSKNLPRAVTRKAVVFIGNFPRCVKTFSKNKPGPAHELREAVAPLNFFHADFANEKSPHAGCE